MPVAFRDVSFTTGTDATAEATIPAGTVDGDWMIAFLPHASSSATITGTPSGWAVQEPDPNPVDFSCICYTRRKQAGDANPTWTWSAAGNWSVDISSWSGVDSANPVNVDVGAISAIANGDISLALTPSINDTMLVGWACIDAVGSARTWSQTGAMTEVLDRLDNAMHRCLAYEQLVGGSGVLQTRVFTDDTAGSTQDVGGFMLALTPALDAMPSLVMAPRTAL